MLVIVAGILSVVVVIAGFMWRKPHVLTGGRPLGQVEKALTELDGLPVFQVRFFQL